MTKEKIIWNQTKELMKDPKYKFGDHWSFNFRNDAKRLAFVLSRYKFAAKIACIRGNSVLELGSSEGIGASILGESVEKYVGVDLDGPAIASSRENYSEDKFTFLHDDFMGKKYGLFDAVVSLDVVEHILPEFEDQYFQTAFENLSENGVCVIGTPNVTSVPYASKASQLGHVNMFSQKRLVETMQKYYHVVLPFGMNDEIVHTGFPEMAHYIFSVGCHKR